MIEIVLFKWKYVSPQLARIETVSVVYSEGFHASL